MAVQTCFIVDVILRLALTAAALVSVSGAAVPQASKGAKFAPMRLIPPQDTYVAGGQEARPHEFPWQVSLQVFVQPPDITEAKWVHNCSGSIVNDQWVVTAAHCVTVEDVPRYRIVAGAHNASKQEATANTFAVSRLVIHPGYERKTLQDDVAMVKVRGRFQLDNASASIAYLPNMSEAAAFHNETCIASGWGMTDIHKPPSDVLLKVSVPIVPNPQCTIAYRFVRYAHITDTKMCAGRRDLAGFGACSGDSGGPLMCYDEGVLKVAGITSFMVICGSQHFPSVFSRVSHYKQWIDSVVAAV